MIAGPEACCNDTAASAVSMVTVTAAFEVVAVAGWETAPCSGLMWSERRVREAAEGGKTEPCCRRL